MKERCWFWVFKKVSPSARDQQGNKEKEKPFLEEKTAFAKTPRHMPAKCKNRMAGK